jgi:hypothetical protein
MFVDMFGRYARAICERHGIRARRVVMDMVALFCIVQLYWIFSIGSQQALVMNEIPSLQNLGTNIYLLNRVTLDVYHENP